MASASTNSSAEESASAEKSNLWSNVKEWFVTPSTPTKTAIKLPENPNETGWDRVRAIWTTYNRGGNSVEAHIITNSVFLGGLCGFSLGSFIGSHTVFSNFIRQYNANVFHGKRDANMKLAEKMYLEMFKKGTYNAVRYGLFSGSFVGMLTVCAAYRNDIYYRDAAISSALVGGLSKAYLGPRAILVNAVGCAFFGLTFAALIRLSMRIMETTVAEMRYLYQVNNSEYLT